jgi:hypothetical protein
VSVSSLQSTLDYTLLYTLNTLPQALTYNMAECSFGLTGRLLFAADDYVISATINLLEQADNQERTLSYWHPTCRLVDQSFK